jgi:DNA mismatch repair protein MSH5
VLTGPNYSGKSIYLKQVALICYMAQIGSFVPAERATLGITDKILTRLSTIETVSRQQSAFMIDLQQIAMALNSCTACSLVVIDEFGKGTDTSDGAGLAAGVLLHLLHLEDQSPKVLAATHFHEIFELGVFEDYTRLQHAHMEVRIDRRSVLSQPADHEDGTSQVTYLYNLREGRSTLSYGAQCAAMNGVPLEIVQRALDLGKWMAQGEDLVAICSALSKQDEKELEMAEVAARAFLQVDFSEASIREQEMVDVLDAILLAGLEDQTEETSSNRTLSKVVS